MRKKLLSQIVILSFGVLFFSCSVSRNQTLSLVGLVPLTGYSLVNNSITKDTSYMAIQNEAQFANVFTGAEKLDLYGKTAVAMVLKNSGSLQFDSAGYIGSKVYVYAQTCSTATEPKCSTGNIFLATIPKVGNAKTVYFFVNNTMRSSVEL